MWACTKNGGGGRMVVRQAPAPCPRQVVCCGATAMRKFMETAISETSHAQRRQLYFGGGGRGGFGVKREHRAGARLSATVQMPCQNSWKLHLQKRRTRNDANSTLRAAAKAASASDRIPNPHPNPNPDGGRRPNHDGGRRRDACPRRNACPRPEGGRRPDGSRLPDADRPSDGVRVACRRRDIH